MCIMLSACVAYNIVRTTAAVECYRELCDFVRGLAVCVCALCTVSCVRVATACADGNRAM